MGRLPVWLCQGREDSKHDYRNKERMYPGRPSARQKARPDTTEPWRHGAADEGPTARTGPYGRPREQRRLSGRRSCKGSGRQTVTAATKSSEPGNLSKPDFFGEGEKGRNS